MGLLNKAMKLLVLTPIAVFFGVMVIAHLVFEVLRRGPRAVFGKKSRPQPPPCLQDPDLGTHGYVYLEEVRLHYVSTGSEGKPLMLLVHGFPEFWYSWRYQLKEFRDSYRVVAIDQRGYGDSDQPSSVSSYDITKLVTDIKNLVSALGYKKCVLVGHDWGGVVTWNVAQRHPEIVDKLIVMNCPTALAYAKLTQSKGGFSQLKKSWYMFFFQLPWLPEVYIGMRDFLLLEQVLLGDQSGVKSGTMSQEDVEAYKYTFGRCGFTAPINYYRQMFRSTDMRTPAKTAHIKVSCPTLIVWGDQDQALEVRLAQLSSELNVEGGATVKIIEGASHFVQMDRPDLVNKYMRRFLSSQM
ncbi:epoxide hydrolase 4-like [Littorina saxatilis]|uniref:AB hydrolase-1 domain-containing protein n=1 Tax=Littorina saxatilis TaxID=31220 RepID=A0AAN9GH96_9CAEN